MQQPRNFDDIKFTSIHRRIMLWGSGGPFLDGYVLVMIGVALEQLTPALKLDAQWIGLLGAGTLAGLCGDVAVWLHFRQGRAAQNVHYRYYRHWRDIGGNHVCLLAR